MKAQGLAIMLVELSIFVAFLYIFSIWSEGRTRKLKEAESLEQGLKRFNGESSTQV